MTWKGHRAQMKEIRNAYIISVAKAEGKKQLGKPTRGKRKQILGN
jgi:hypothetical protein